jgi:hypothetical protein
MPSIPAMLASESMNALLRKASTPSAARKLLGGLFSKKAGISAMKMTPTKWSVITSSEQIEPELLTW